MRAPNIVWLFPDEWRHDAVGYAGNPVVRTPHLDALARRGTAFTGAHCEAPLCQPSRASLLSLSYPRDHGRIQNGPSPHAGPFPPPGAPNLLHRLQEAGYRTAEVGKMHFFDGLHSEDALRAYGFDDVVEEHDKVVQRTEFAKAVVTLDTPYTAYLAERGLLDRWRDHQDVQTASLFGSDPTLPRAMPEDLDPEHALDAFIGREACRLLREHAAGEQPLFLWVGFVGPHPPFDGPAPFADLYDPATLPMGPLGSDPLPDNRWGAFLASMAELFHMSSCTEADVRLMAKHYYASITLIDEAVGRIVATLADIGAADNTWIVFSSDHGELLGDHGLLTKATFTRGSVQVPMFVAPPEGAPGHARHVPGLVQGIDLPATILDVAGADASGFHGRSVLAATETWSRPVVFSQLGDFAMVNDGRTKLVVTTDTVEPQMMHDLVADPDERVDVCGDLSHERSRAEMLESWMHPFLAGELS